MKYLAACMKSMHSSHMGTGNQPRMCDRRCEQRALLKRVSAQTLTDDLNHRFIGSYESTEQNRTEQKIFPGWPVCASSLSGRRLLAPSPRAALFGHWVAPSLAISVLTLAIQSTPQSPPPPTSCVHLPASGVVGLSAPKNWSCTVTCVLERLWRQCSQEREQRRVWGATVADSPVHIYR